MSLAWGVGINHYNIMVLDKSNFELVGNKY